MKITSWDVYDRCNNGLILNYSLCCHSQSSSLITMKAVMGSTCRLTFQVFTISGPKLNSAIKISLNSSTSSLTMVKFLKSDLLFGVNTKSWIVFTASLRPDSAWKGASNISVWVPAVNSQNLTCHLSIAKTPVTKQRRRISYKCSLNGSIKGNPLKEIRDSDIRKCVYI